MSDFLADVERALPGAVDAIGEQAIIRPESARAVAEILRLAHGHATALQVPGSDPHEGRPILQLDRLAAIVSVDDVSRILHVQAGAALGDVEQTARRNAWTLGLSEAIHGERLKHAREFLMHTDANVNEIARECGFNSAAYFRRSFKTAEGMSPTHWRRLHGRLHANTA